MNTDKKTALVTGAGKGIGRAVALKLTQQRIRVIAVARTATDLDSLWEESGESVTPWCLDATSEEMLEKIAEEERIDILVNNVGTNIPEPFIGVSEQNLDHLLSLNVRTAFRVAQAVSRKMIAARLGEHSAYLFANGSCGRSQSHCLLYDKACYRGIEQSYGR